MIFEAPVIFHSQGVPLAGRFLRATASLDERRPAVIVVGSWLTVKEQMALAYGRKLAEAGYAAFVFDFAGFGQSDEQPRQAEIPSRKIADIRSAVEHIRTVSFVDSERIACVAICASAQYVLAALAEGAPIRSFASVAGWYHDLASVAPFYGGQGGVERRLAQAHGRLPYEAWLRPAAHTCHLSVRSGQTQCGADVDRPRAVPRRVAQSTALLGQEMQGREPRRRSIVRIWWVRSRTRSS